MELNEVRGEQGLVIPRTARVVVPWNVAGREHRTHARGVPCPAHIDACQPRVSVLGAHQPNLQRVAAQSQVVGIKRLAGHVTDGGFVRQITRRQGPNHRRCDHVLGTAQRL